MRVRASAVWLALIVSSGCADSCACGSKAGGAASPEPTTTTTTNGTGGQTAAVGETNPSAAQAGAAAPPVSHDLPAWEPAPESELTQRLRAAQTSIERDEAFGKLADPKAFLGVLSDKLGTLKAEDKASSTSRTDDKNALLIAARNYRGGGTNVRVKITDTASLPSARRVVSNRLTMIGNEAAGDERASFVRGYPTVLGHIDAQKISRANALIGGRYLVQIMVQGAQHPDDAAHYLEQLDWSALAPKQGKLPEPEPKPEPKPMTTP